MVNAGKWLRRFLTGKKDRSHESFMEKKVWVQLSPLLPPPPPPPTTPMEKSRRSFRLEPVAAGQIHKVRVASSSEHELSSPAAKKHNFGTIREVAAIRIQASFRSFLARKALRALRGLVKLQAVVRGFLVRKQAAAAVRGMQALLTVQVRARAQRARIIREQEMLNDESGLHHLYDILRNVNTFVEMDLKQSRVASNNYKSKDRSPPSSSTSASTDRPEESFARSRSQHSSPARGPRKTSPSRADYVPERSRTMPQECSFPSYMSKTESWKAKARSLSVPRQRSGSIDSKQYGKQKASADDGRNFSRAARASPISSAISREKVSWNGDFDRTASITKYYGYIET